MPGVKGMRTGGQNRKPRQLRVIAGTFRADRDYGADVQAPAGEPETPAGLSGVAQAEWTRVAGHLRALGVLSRVDDAVIENYARLAAMAARLEQTAAELGSLCYEKTSVDGAGVEHREPRVHPVVSQLRSYRAAMRQALGDFGLTPSSRARVSPLSTQQPSHSDPRKAKYLDALDQK